MAQQDMLGSGALAEVAGPFKDFAEKLVRHITLGVGGASADNLAKRLKNGGYDVSNLASDIISKPAFTTLPEATTIELGWIMVRDLGFTTEPITMELFARIKEVADLCPAEVGPHLRLADADQQCGTRYWVAIEPISVSVGSPDVFFVGRYDDGRRWLYAGYADPDDRWDLDSTIVVRLCK